MVGILWNCGAVVEEFAVNQAGNNFRARNGEQNVFFVGINRDFIVAVGLY